MTRFELGERSAAAVVVELGRAACGPAIALLTAPADACVAVPPAGSIRRGRGESADRSPDEAGVAAPVNVDG